MIELKKLNYAYTDLEEVIDSKTMEIHHTLHHQTYINNLNNALKSVGKESMTLEEVTMNFHSLDESIKTAVQNNGGGVLNHNLYFGQFTKDEVSASEKFQKLIEESFDSLELLIEKMQSAGVTRFGSGWSFLVLKNGKLEVMSTPNQDNPLMLERDVFPLLAIDVWEHAYYLKYQNRRPEYLTNIFKIINWEIIEDRYNKALEKNISYIN